jgi:hypothetical protein
MRAGKSCAHLKMQRRLFRKRGPGRDAVAYRKSEAVEKPEASGHSARVLHRAVYSVDLPVDARCCRM